MTSAAQITDLLKQCDICVCCTDKGLSVVRAGRARLAASLNGSAESADQVVMEMPIHCTLRPDEHSEPRTTERVWLQVCSAAAMSSGLGLG